MRCFLVFRILGGFWEFGASKSACQFAAHSSVQDPEIAGFVVFCSLACASEILTRKEILLIKKRHLVRNVVCSQFRESLFAIVAECSQYCLRCKGKSITLLGRREGDRDTKIVNIILWRNNFLVTPRIHVRHICPTGVPDDGNEWKLRVVPRSHTLYPLILYLVQ